MNAKAIARRRLQVQRARLAHRRFSTSWTERLEARRLLSDVAQLDPTFADNGIALTGFTNENPYGAAVVCTSAGKPIIAVNQAYSGPDFTTGLNLARFNTDGSLDTSFGNQGNVSVAIDRFGIGDAALQSDGKLLVAGTVADPNYPNSSTDVLRFIVLRFNTDGSLDTSFGTNGSVRTAFTSIDPTFSAEAKHIAIGPTGTIAVGGSTMRYVEDGDHVGLALAEYNSSGQLLTSFSGDGLLTNIVTAPSSEELYGLGFQPDGKLLISYTAFDASASSQSVFLRVTTSTEPSTAPSAPAARSSRSRVIPGCWSPLRSSSPRTTRSFLPPAMARACSASTPTARQTPPSAAATASPTRPVAARSPTACSASPMAACA